MTAVGLLRRVRRLEQARRARKRIRVVECWPGEPKPVAEAEAGELLVLVTRFCQRPAGRAAGP
jgi:hypothetical protein